MRKIGLLSLVATTALMASGYKIPEQSQKSVALSAANVANAHGADASYENPANMAFETGNGSFEFGLNYIHLPAVKFEGTYAPPFSVQDSSGATSKKENFLIPTFYYVSPAVNDFRFGLALVSPVGLAKRWDEQPGKTMAEEFSLKTYEINPTMSYKINDEFAIAAGIRMLYSEGVVKSSGTPTLLVGATRDMEGDALDFGYNFALSYRPSEEVKLAATYRSNIDIDVDGSATLSDLTGGSYSGSASVSIPAPATLNLAAAYTFEKTTTVEFVFERTYWSKYEALDFDYQGDKSSMSALLIGAFDVPSARNWKDVNSYRLGVTHELNPEWTLMAGTVYFDTPMPEENLGFEHPDAQGMAYSAGARYKVNEQYEVGASFLYADRHDRTVSASNRGINGTFSGMDVYYLSLGVEYKF